MNIKGFEHLKYIFEKNLDVGLISEEMDVCSIEETQQMLREN